MQRLAILKTGGYTLPLVDSVELLAFLESPKDAKWLLEKTGINAHSLNFNPATGKKITNENSLDYAEHAAREALENLNIDSWLIDHLCLATCTPANLHFSGDAIELHRRLGLRPDAAIDQVDGGCAALAKAFQLIQVYANASTKQKHYALIVATNDVASFIDKYRYRANRGDDAWLSPAIFADGAGAMILGSWPLENYLRGTYAAVNGDHPLVSYKGGGAADPTNLYNVNEHAYVMDSKDVALQFMPAMERVVNYFLGKFYLKIEDIQRWYLHQANFRFLEKFSQVYHIPMEKIPHNVDRLGNTVSASTLLLLDEDIKNGNFPKEGPVLFLFVGAGMMEGGALFLK